MTRKKSANIPHLHHSSLSLSTPSPHHDWGIMGVNILILLLIWSNLVSKCMAECAITPDINGHVTIPDDWEKLVNGAIPSRAFIHCSSLQSVTIGSNLSILIDDYAFFDCNNLTTLSFGTISEVDINTGAFQGCDKLEQLYLNKSLAKISGLPAGFVERYYCNDGTCGCKDGYGNIHDTTSSLYRCEACPKGKTSGGGLSECIN